MGCIVDSISSPCTLGNRSLALGCDILTHVADDTEDPADRFEILLQLGAAPNPESCGHEEHSHDIISSPGNGNVVTCLTVQALRKRHWDIMDCNIAGRGSYGSVFKARLKATGEFVAIKVIQLGEEDRITDIQKEISMLSECNHPNVVRYMVRLGPCRCGLSDIPQGIRCFM